MKRTSCWGARAIAAAALAVGIWGAPHAVSAVQSPRAVLSAALAQMGGERTLRGIRRVEFRAVGYRAMVEQSERPAGPFLLDQIDLHEILDLTTGAARIEQSDGAYAGADWWLTQPAQPASTQFVRDDVEVARGTDGKLQSLGGFDVARVRERIALGPERLLLTALAAPDLRLLADRTLHGVRHRVVSFTWPGETSRATLPSPGGRSSRAACDFRASRRFDASAYRTSNCL